MNFKYMLKELFAEKTRVILTIIAISWGTFSITLMLSVGQGMLVSMTQLMHKMGDNMLVVIGGHVHHSRQSFAGGSQVQLDLSDIKSVKVLRGVKRVVPEYVNTVTIRHGQYKLDDQAVVGAVSDYSLLKKMAILPGGRFITPLDNARKAPVIVLGHDVAQTLFPMSNPVGQWVTINNYAVQVVGVTQNTAQLFRYQPPDVQLTWIPYTTFNGLYAPTSVPVMLVQLDANADRGNIKQAIRTIVANRLHASPHDPTIVQMIDNQEMIQRTTDFFDGVKMFLGIVGFITLLVASLGIANIMYVAVQRAYGEIGIRMACGAQPYHIVRQYVLEALMVTFIGGILGVIVARLLIAIGNLILVNYKIADTITIQLSLSPGLYIAILAILGFVGLLAGVFPARRAARIQPVEALRYE